MIEKYKETANFIKNKINFTPKVCIVLGSGLGGFAEKIENKISFPYNELPNFPVSTVEGHAGRLIAGTLAGQKVIAMQGRFHYYEGYEMAQVTFPVRVMKFLGVEYFFVSNAAGGLNPDFEAGDLMIIEDHINMFPRNPLIGKNYNEIGTRFPDMSKTYNPELREKAKKIAAQNNIAIKTGVYVGSSGPTLETPAEYKFFRNIGADATGMSTVPEVIVAHHAGMKCFGISVITNTTKPATPDGETTHDEVQNVAGIAEPKMSKIFTDLIATLS